MSCRGSMWCEFCGGVCSLDSVADSHPYQEGILDTDDEPTHPNQPADGDVTPAPEPTS